jgi:hypothetical protein
MEDTKECVVCREGIHLKARKCIRCGSYQNRITRNVIFYGSIAGVITLMVSAFLFILDSANRYISRIDPFVIQRYSYNEGAVLMNRSFDKLYAHSIVILTNHNRSMYSEPLNMLVDQKDISIHLKPKEGYAIYPGKLNEAQWDKAWSNGNNCFDVFFSLAEKREALRIAQASLNYVSTYDGKVRKQNFEVGVFLKLKDKKECSNYGNAGSLFR